MTSCPQYQPIEKNMNGVYHFTPTKFAAITDGTSNTMLYSEKANGLFTATDSICYNWWADAVSGDSLFDTLYPMNRVPKGENDGAAHLNTVTRGLRARRASIPAVRTSRSRTVRCTS